MNIAERLQELRKKAGYSQEQVAEMLGISRQAISKWESGQGNPEIDNVIKLTEIYHVSADYILLGQESNAIVSTPEKKPLSKEARKAIGIITKERTGGGLNKRAIFFAPLFSTLSVFPN